MSSWKAPDLLRDGQDLLGVSYSPPSTAALPFLQWVSPGDDYFSLGDPAPCDCSGLTGVKLE